MNNISLTGKHHNNEHTLMGKTKVKETSIPFEIKNMKIKILNDFLIPLFTKQWSTLYKNLYFLDRIKKKLSRYSHFSFADELDLYFDLLELLQLVTEKHKLLEDQERKTSSSNSKEQIISMVFRLAPIRLLPEYELYNSILGKPNRELKETYDMDKINTIKQLLNKENIDYDQVEDFLKKKYPSII
jgi:hypothetical protein